MVTCTRSTRQAAMSARFIVLMPGVGHMGHLDMPDRFNGEVRGFLRTLEGL
jgi:pimeloyl-ACP methyl ester carboxylesterase